MKVLLINGSAREKGCTYTALSEVSAQLNKNGIDTEIIHIGKTVTGCMACGACSKLGRCVIDDKVNEVAEKAKTAGGFVFGSPVYYASPNGSMLGFMDRLFYSSAANFAYKPAACVTSARRGGTTASYDVLNKYLGISKMITVGSNYWNMVHGNSPDEVKQDEEGLQTMRILGDNMAWILKLIENGKNNGITPPESEPKIKTNFIR